MKACWMALFLLGIATLTYGQCTRLRGVLLDAETKEVLPGATLYLTTNISQGTTTNDKGEFEMSAIIGDQLTVTFIGYETQKITVDSSCYVLLDLSPVATNLNEMTIQAERLTAEEFSIKKIRKLDILNIK